MNFYRRRPLAAAITVAIAVSAAAASMSEIFKIILAAAISAAAVGMIFLFKKLGREFICNMRAHAFILLCTALTACMMLTSFAYYNVYAGSYAKRTSGEICGVVTEVKSQSSYEAVYAVKLYTADGESSAASGLIASDTAVSLSVGDIVKTFVSFVPLEDFYDYQSPSVGRLGLLADGYVFAGDTVSHVDKVGHSNGIEVFFPKLRQTLSEKVALYLDKDSAALADALLLGSRDELGRIRRDFMYCGVMHILSLSGLHIAILSGLFERMLRRLGVGRTVRYITVIAVMAFYTALTGFLMSVIRASLMMAFSYIAALFDSENDRVTSLFIAVGIIVLVSPGAVFDIGMQLSFFATLGVILMSEAADKASEKIKNHKSDLRPVLIRLRKLFSNVAASLGATLFVLPLQWLYFGEMALMSVPATLIISFICEGMLMLLPFELIFSLLGWHFMGGRLGWIIDMLSRICADAAEWMAGFSRIISLRYPFAVVIVLLLVGCILFMIIRNFPSWFYALIPLAASVLLFTCMVFIHDAVYANRVSVDYVGEKSHDAIAVTARGRTMVIDITDGSAAVLNKLKSSINERYVTEIDTVLFTDVSRRHINALRSFMKYRVVKRILVPMPTDESERYRIADLMKIAEEYGAETVIYKNGAPVELNFSGVEISMPARTVIKRSVQPLTAVRIAFPERNIVYMGASSWESDTVWKYSEDADIIILGSNGPKVKSAPQYIARDAELICMSGSSASDTLLAWAADSSCPIICRGRIHITVDP